MTAHKSSSHVMTAAHHSVQHVNKHRKTDQPHLHNGRKKKAHAHTGCPSTRQDFSICMRQRGITYTRFNHIYIIIVCESSTIYTSHCCETLCTSHLHMLLPSKNMEAAGQGGLKQDNASRAREDPSLVKQDKSQAAVFIHKYGCTALPAGLKTSAECEQKVVLPPQASISQRLAWPSNVTAKNWIPLNLFNRHTQLNSVKEPAEATHFGERLNPHKKCLLKYTTTKTSETLSMSRQAKVHEKKKMPGVTYLAFAVAQRTRFTEQLMRQLVQAITSQSLSLAKRNAIWGEIFCSMIVN